MAYTEIIEVPMGTRADVIRPIPEFFATVGEEGMRILIDAHYELLKVSDAKHLFPIDNDEEFALAKKHAGDFFIQYLGGPKYFEASRGAPQMVGRHAPFAITPNARKTWLLTYQEALKVLDVSAKEKESFWDYLNTFSTWMVNTPA
ncbi:MAG TPA: globin [Campylobacterales bacterium]|nr:globin [Campylobacterales bacterium]